MLVMYSISSFNSLTLFLPIACTVCLKNVFVFKTSVSIGLGTQSKLISWHNQLTCYYQRCVLVYLPSRQLVNHPLRSQVLTHTKMLVLLVKISEHLPTKRIWDLGSGIYSQAKMLFCLQTVTRRTQLFLFSKNT